MATKTQTRVISPSVPIVIFALLVFCLLFLFVDSAYYRFASSVFPLVGDSPWLATLWGLFSRLHLLIFLVPLVIWRPKYLGFQIGKSLQEWKLLLFFLLLNCGVIFAYFYMTGSSSPYSGNQWLVTEIITVPIVEETFWRGLVFAALLALFRGSQNESTSVLLTIWFSGIAFGLLHAGNALAGVPLEFVAIQVLNASIWGVLYGYARAKTDSIYPSILLHSAMNLVVVLF
jgi:membrane protease YdiL (CAAX protease family)